MKSIKTLALGAGFAFVTLAMFVQGVLPSVVPEARSTRVTRAVRTDLGEVKWVRAEARDYTDLERRGRSVYIREGCWYCHSQYVRPVAGEELRWGPVAEAGEYAYDLPHLLATRRIGPDLSRVGWKYSDDWHYAHYWNPRLAVPDSIMPRFPWLFVQVRVPVQATAEGLELPWTPALAPYFTGRTGNPIRIFPNDAGIAFVPPAADGRWPLDGWPVLDATPFKGRPPALGSVLLVLPTREAVGLVRYVQKLGMNRGAWREVFEPQNVAVSAMRGPEGEDLRARGEEVYRQRCAGCHGREGHGNGPAAAFLSPRPRDFTAGVFKFRTTPSGSLPTDGDLFRTVTRGVRWTAMPTWHELAAKDRRAVVSFIKTFSPRWKAERPEPPFAIAGPPPPTPERLARGRALYRSAKCFECHGDLGKGDGPLAGQLKDDFDLPIRPTDLSRGQFKGGSHVADVYRAMTLGLDGTPMPSFADSMSDEERWAISYFVLSLSAWVDPATGEKLSLPARAKAALNAGDAGASHPRSAWDPEARPDLAQVDPGKRRRYYRGIAE
jgi:cytochrome c oxidase cbb3-type subunit 2